MSGTPQKIKTYCNKCQGKVNHDVMANHKERWDDDKTGIWSLDEYMIVKCAGCEETHFLRRNLFSEDHWPEDDPETAWVVEAYPPRLARRIPDWLDELEEDIADVLRETYSALHNDLCRLAVVGTRTALEMVIVKQIGDLGGFEDKVRQFAAKGFMAHNLIDPLLKTLDAGNASAHRGFLPDEKALADIFDLVEGIINSTCIIPIRSSAVHKVTPQRHKAPKVSP